MVRWIPYTFVRTVIFFIGGIVSGYHWPGLISERLTLAIALALVIAYIALVRFYDRRRLNPGMIGLLLIFLLGYAHIRLQTESGDDDHLLHCSERVTRFRAVVTRFAEERERSWKIEARVDGVCTSSWESRRGGIVLYLSKDDFPEPFVYGDILLIRRQPQLPDPAMNPGQFDYRRYLSFRNIYHQCYVRGRDVSLIGHAPDNVVRDFAYKGRRWAEQALRRYVRGDREQAVASALVLGVTDGLDQDLLEAYSGTGTMHILAVSGLHISVIYLILLRILSPLNRSGKGRWVVAVISLCSLWLYALITGLSPSVLRAVMMFSFLAIAKPWARSTNVHNTLAVSALCLLVYDPFLVFSVGFQLSYMAVMGIVSIYPRLLQLWEPRHLVTVEVWKAGAVSIAAQVATLPVSLLYFHQFPNYFLVSNLLVVPLSFVVLITGLVVIGVGSFSIVAGLIGLCLTWVIRFVNGIVFTMDSLPFAAIENIHITLPQSFLLVLLISFCVALSDTRSFLYVVWCFATVVLFSVLQWVHFHRHVSVRKIAVYCVPGHSAIELIDRGVSCLVADEGLKGDVRTMRYYIAPYRIISGVTREVPDVPVREFRGGKIAIWNGGRVLQLTDDDYEIPGVLIVDWLVISNNAVDDPGEVLDRVNCTAVVLDSSNSFLFATRFLEAAKLYNLDVHSVLHQGAYVREIENRDT